MNMDHIVKGQHTMTGSNQPTKFLGMIRLDVDRHDIGPDILARIVGYLIDEHGLSSQIQNGRITMSKETPLVEFRKTFGYDRNLLPVDYAALKSDGKDNVVGEYSGTWRIESLITNPRLMIPVGYYSNYEKKPGRKESLEGMMQFTIEPFRI